MLNAAIARFNQALSTGYITDIAVETAEYAGASAAFGYFGVKYRDKKILGMDLPLGIGLIGTAAQLGIEMLAPGYGRAAEHLGVVSRAGIGAWAHAVGASMAAQGQKRLLLPKGADTAAAQKAIPGSTVLGGLPGAPEGDYLTREQLAELANR